MRYLFGLIALLLYQLPGSAAASTCTLTEFKQAYEMAALVFVGRASKVTYENDAERPHGNLCGSKTVTFEVTELFKGKAPQTVDVFAADGCVRLGGYFEPDKEYLIYATSGKSLDGVNRYESSVCMRSTLLGADHAKEDMKRLMRHGDPQAKHKKPKSGN